MTSRRAHNHRDSFNYLLSHDIELRNAQDNWRWCRKCQSLAWAGSGEGICPAGGKHDHNESYNYVLLHDIPFNNVQDNWRWCNQCQVLTFAGNPDQGVCPEFRQIID